MLSHTANELVSKKDFSPARWITGLAVCEAALDAGQQSESIKELFTQLFRARRDSHVGMMLDDANYRDWREHVMQVCRKMIAAGHLRAWAELAELYLYVREPYREQDRYRDILHEGVAAGDSVSRVLLGRNLSLGENGEPLDRELGRSWIERSKAAGYEYAELYLLLVELEHVTDPEGYLARLLACMDTLADQKPWALLGDVYDYVLHDTPKAMAAYEKGVEDNEPKSKYMLGSWILDGKVEGASQEQGIQLLEEAYLYGIVGAASFLGQHYAYNQHGRDLDKAIEWFERAVRYYDANAMLGLLELYLHEDACRDLAKGMFYLDMAIAEKLVPAIKLKAFMLMENDEGCNIPLAKELLEQATDLGDDYAPYLLACGYQKCVYSTEPDYAKALEYYLLSANRNYVYAMEMTGRYFCVGMVGEPNPEQAVEWYRRALEHNSDYAQVELAFCYESGYGVAQDFQQAYELYCQAAENNNPNAHVKLGYYFMNGVLGEPDNDKAFHHFSLAAELKSPEAYYNLGRMYKYATGRPENPALAMDYFLKGVEGDHWDACVELALAYENEYADYPFDADKAMEFMCIAADNDIPYAQYKLGYYYYFGLVEVDMAKGLEWLHKAYANGSPLAAILLGDHCLYARADEDDRTESFHYYKAAEEQGYVSEGIGLCYQYGIGVEQNQAEAFKYFNQAADLGYASAKYQVGLCHMNGIGTVKSMSEAYCWLLQSAEAGNINAQYDVGMLLLTGDGVAMDQEKGLDWLMKAAEEEQDDAQLELGNCYLMGRGVDEDEVQAMFWYLKAAESGNIHAQKLTGQRKRK